MHYYTHNIGEFAQKTRFMSPEEIGIYVILKDEYYANGMRIASDRIANLMPPGCESSLKRVLHRFFIEKEGFYECAEFDAELTAYKDKGSINSENAKKRWEKRRNASKSEPNGTNGDTNVCESHTTRISSDANSCLTNNKELRTNNQELVDINTRPKATRPKTQKLVKPEGVSDQVWSEWQALKRKLCKSCTQRMVDAIVREADKAGMTVEEAMTYQLEKGWKGFEAEWVHNSQPKNRPTDPQYGIGVCKPLPIEEVHWLTDEERAESRRQMELEGCAPF